MWIIVVGWLALGVFCLVKAFVLPAFMRKRKLQTRAIATNIIEENKKALAGKAGRGGCMAE